MYLILLLTGLPGQYYEMSSFPETKVEKYVTKTKGKFFAKYPFSFSIIIFKAGYVFCTSVAQADKI